MRNKLGELYFRRTVLKILRPCEQAKCLSFIQSVIYKIFRQVTEEMVNTFPFRWQQSWLHDFRSSPREGSTQSFAPRALPPLREASGSREWGGVLGRRFNAELWALLGRLENCRPEGDDPRSCGCGRADLRASRERGDRKKGNQKERKSKKMFSAETET